MADGMAKKDEKDEREDECDKFWDTIESETGAQIPSYIRNIVKHNGFNSALSMQLLDENDLNDIETMVRSGTMISLLPNDFDFKTIYGPFYESVDKFTFLRGHRKCLFAITAHIKEKGSKNISKTNIFTNTTGKSKNDSASQFKDRNVSLVARSTDRLDINKEQGIVLQKIITWVKSFNPAAYEKCKEKINCEMLVVKFVEPSSVDPAMKLSAEVKCPKWVNWVNKKEIR